MKVEDDKSWNSHEGAILEVTRLRNLLRSMSYSDLSELPEFYTDVKKFRGAPVCLAVAKEINEDGSLAFLIVGQIPLSNFSNEDGFLKYQNEKWDTECEYDYSNLRNIIEEKAPKLP